MITTKKLLGAATLGLATLATSSISAQTSTDNQSAGLIGKRYVGADFLLSDSRDSADNGTGGALILNHPASEVLDFTASYAFSQIDGKGADLTQNSLSFGTVYYSQVENYKPFLSASLGYGWDKLEFPAPRPGDNDEGFLFHVGAGVEVPLTEKTAAIGEISYRDGVDSDTEDSWGLELGVNHWITEKVALKASVYLVEDDTVTFRIGARLGF